jgi:hypothetical protein
MSAGECADYLSQRRYGRSRIVAKRPARRGERNVRVAIALAESALAVHEAIEAKADAEKVRTALTQWRASSPASNAKESSGKR